MVVAKSDGDAGRPAVEKLSCYAAGAQSVEAVLVNLLHRMRARGLRVLVHCGNEERQDTVDHFLWTYADDSFLPHGAPGSEFDAEQPVVVASALDNVNAAHVLVLLDADPMPQTGFAHVVVVYSERDRRMADHAKTLYATAVARRCVVARWHQNSTGGWTAVAAEQGSEPGRANRPN